jgi:hypothetical protein
VWLRMRTLRNMDHKWAWFHLPSKLANSIDIAACSIGLSLFLPVYHWSKCGLEGKKKVGQPWLPWLPTRLFIINGFIDVLNFLMHAAHACTKPICYHQTCQFKNDIITN